MRSGWFLSNGKWYYLGAANDGSMKTGWQLVNGSWYYMNPGNGDMAVNQWIGNYYVGGSGAMLTNQWIGNYYVDGSGKWVPGKTTDKRFVVTKRAYTKSTWVEPKTVECNEIGFEVKTPMYREEERIICGGCGRDVTDDYKTDSLESHINTEALKGNDNCASTYSDYRMVQYDTRNVIYPATYVVDKEKYVEKIQHDAEYKTVVDRDEWAETITKNICSECGAVQ